MHILKTQVVSMYHQFSTPFVLFSCTPFGTKSYPTSILLNKMGISNSKNCAFGCSQTDYPEHFFFSCKKISTIWEYVEEKVYRKFEVNRERWVMQL